MSADEGPATCATCGEVLRVGLVCPVCLPEPFASRLAEAELTSPLARDLMRSLAARSTPALLTLEQWAELSDYHRARLALELLWSLVGAVPTDPVRTYISARFLDGLKPETRELLRKAGK